MHEQRRVAGRGPVGRAAIGASHEVYPSAQAACHAAVARSVAGRVAQEAERRRAGGRRRHLSVSTPLLRSIDGDLDDLKFLYPVLDNLPLIVFPVLSYALAGVRLSVYGPPAVGAVLEVVRNRLLRDGLIPDGDRLLFAEEDRTEVSLAQTFRRSTAPLAAGPGETMVWSAGDIVLAYNVYPKLMDRHAGAYELVFDLNCRQIIFPKDETELFARNYFDSLRLDDGRVVDVKEPNALLFTPAGMGGLSKLDALRSPAPGRTYVGELLRAALGVARRAPPAAMLALLRYGVRRSRAALRPSDGLPQRHAVALASAIFGVPTMVKTETTDPFLVRDCDSFEDLFGYYRALLQSVVDSAATRDEGYRELAKYYPYASVLRRLSDDLRDLQADLPLWRRWPEWVGDKIATHNHLLQKELAGAGLPPTAGMIPHYFDARGVYRLPSQPTDDLAASKAFLRGRYHAAFAADRAAYLQLSSAPGPRRPAIE